MNVRFFIGSFIENNQGFLKIFAITMIAFLILRSCFSTSKASLPSEVHELIDRKYINCIEVKDSHFEGGNQLESECSTVTTEVVGEGTIPQQERVLGITQAICYRIQYENPYFWADSQTQYEEIDFATRTSSKVTVLQNSEWVIFPDQEIQDRERWNTYSCPGEYEIAK